MKRNTPRTNHHGKLLPKHMQPTDVDFGDPTIMGDLIDYYKEESAKQFGGCNVCFRNDGFVNVGKAHIFYCATHKTRWLVGSNLFSGWRSQTEAMQREIYNEIGIGSFNEIVPTFPTDDQDRIETQEAQVSVKHIHTEGDPEISERVGDGFKTYNAVCPACEKEYLADGFVA